jgi:retron-type reverse transcriptase
VVVADGGPQDSGPRVLRLIRQWLRAGVLESGEWRESVEGTPQGSGISPLPANIFLHYVLNLWIQQWRKSQARGSVIFVRYCDDFVIGFQYEEDARRLWADLSTRLSKFGLGLHEDKTRLLEFGKFAKEGFSSVVYRGRKRSIFWDSPTIAVNRGMVGSWSNRRLSGNV